MTRRRAKTRRWAQAQGRDPWVRKARARGLPSRAAFKLEEILARHRLLGPGKRVLELGAAPGGWTRLALAAVGPTGRVVAVDRLSMAVPARAVFVQGDLSEEAVQAKVLAALGGTADVVLCDLAPNLTGIADVDEAAQAELHTLAADVTAGALEPGGLLLIKTFSGPASEALAGRLRREYRRVRPLKPAASRAASSEFYLLAEGFGRHGE